MRRTERPHALHSLCAISLTTLLLAACGSSTPAQLSQAIDGPGVLSPEALANTPIFDGPQAAPTPCAEVADCDDANPCTEDLCLDGVCERTALPLQQCCQDTPLSFHAFDPESAAELKVLGGTGDVQWNLSASRAVSPPTSAHFGDPTSGRMGGGERVGGTLLLPAVTLPAEPFATLSFWIYTDIDSSPNRDTLRIFADLVVPGGLTIATVRLMGKEALPSEAYDGFIKINLPVDELAGHTVRLRLKFDSIVAPSAARQGVFIDDLEITTRCPEDARESSDDGSGSPSTVGEDTTGASTDTITGGDGANTSSESEAAHGTSGGSDSSGTLVSGDAPADPCDAPDAHANCCTSDADCDDGNAATVNVCEGAECVAAWSPAGCEVDSDCADGEACTIDRCVSGQCVFEGVFGDACCAPGSQTLASFDSESLEGIFVTDNLETGVFWRPDPTRATSGGFSLYCGEPQAQTYGIGERVKSSATTPMLTLPPGGQTRLRFDLFMITRPDTHLDVFQVFVLRDGALTPVWSSKVFVAGTTAGFLPIDVDLSSYAGQSIQLRFVFDSVDGHASSLEGTYLDSLRLETTCD